MLHIQNQLTHSILFTKNNDQDRNYPELICVENEENEPTQVTQAVKAPTILSILKFVVTLDLVTLLFIGHKLIFLFLF